MVFLCILKNLVQYGRALCNFLKAFYQFIFLTETIPMSKIFPYQECVYNQDKLLQLSATKYIPYVP